MAAPASPLRIAVLGAGIAGLAAARRLGDLGHEVTVIETQLRPGGRAMTLRGTFTDGLDAHCGPARFPSEFRRFLRVANELKIELAPFYPERGRFVSLRDGIRVDDHLPSAEEFWGYVERTGRSSRGGDSLPRRAVSALRSVMRRALGRPAWQTYRVVGGTDRLTTALAAATKAEFRYGAQVTSVRQGVDRVGVNYRTEQGSEELIVDRVVCALPLCNLSQIEFSPTLPLTKSELVAQIPFSSAVRVFLEMRRAYWREGGYNGFAVTDTVGEIWDLAHAGPPSPAMLVCYAQHDLADRLGALTENDRIEAALDTVEKVFPGAREHFVRGATFSWRERSWIDGGWPLVRGFAERVVEFETPDERVHFAGDYAASPRFLNMMEGAIEAGERAAAQIHSLR